MGIEQPVDSDQSSANTSDIESSTGGSRSTGDDSGDVQNRLIKNEERAVKRAKIFVGTSVFLCVVAIVLAVYFLTTSSDTRSFELAVSDVHHALSSTPKVSAPQVIFSFLNSARSMRLW